MATNEPPPHPKRKVAEITPSDEETTRTYYVLEEGKYVPVKKAGVYVAPPAPAPAPDSDSDKDVDPVLKAEYYRQRHESDGFDLNVSIPNGSLFPHKCYPHDEDEIGICARVGLHCFNFHKGTNLRLLRLEKYNVMFAGLMTYFITADVIDPSSSTSPFVFQTCVTQTTLHNNEDFRIQTERCRLKPGTQGYEAEEEGCHEAIHDFYKGDLMWLPDDAFVQSSDQFYQVEDSDICENDWLNLYADYAFNTLWEYGLTKLKFATPLEITKVVVQTHEAMEPKERLKAGNAVFYVSFRDCGLTEEHRAVVRRTTDGHPAHLCLEVKCLVEGKSGCSICN